MMRIKHKYLMITAFVSLAILSGCTNSNSDAIINGIEDTAQAIGNSVQTTASEWSDEFKRNGINTTVSLSKEVASSVSGMVLKNEVGRVDVKGTTGNKINVSATIWSLDKSLRDAKYQEIMDNAEITAVVSGDQLEIKTHPKGNEKQDLWKWAKKEYGFSNFSIDYVVEIPDTVNRYEISSEVGEINLSNLKGIYDVRNNVGSISIEGAHIQGNSTVGSEVGKLQLGIDQMEVDSSLKATSEVGSIKANLAETLQVSLETDSEVGSIKGAPKGKSDINGGGPLLSLSSSVGSITVE